MTWSYEVYRRNNIHKTYLDAYDHSLPFVLISPKHTPKRDIPEYYFNKFISKEQIDGLIEEMKTSDVVALDYEANGTNIYSKSFKAVGVGLAGKYSRCYIRNLNVDIWNYLHQRLCELDNLIAHNVMFDGAVFKKYAGQHAGWRVCTLALYKQLANEGFNMQRWGLKPAQTDVLEWTETNEVDLDNWLIDNGYIKNGIKQRRKESSADYRARYKEWVKTTPQKIRVDKGQMWRAPSAILGKYCILDCEATYLLHVHHLEPLYKPFPKLFDFHVDTFMPFVKQLIDQYLRGIRVDVEALQSHRKFLMNAIAETEKEFRSNPEVKDLVLGWEHEKLKEHIDKEPVKFKKKPKLSKEPAKLKKNGDISKVYQNWLARKEELENTPAEVSVLWRNWADKKERIEAGLEKSYKFNIDSKMQLKSIIYGSVVDWKEGKEHIAFGEDNNGQYGSVFVRNFSTGKFVELDRTASGGMPIGDLALKQMGEVGDILRRYNGYTKELSYIVAYADVLEHNMSENIYTIHPSFMAPGTLTGRLSGRNPNFQQIPKSQGTLQCFIPRDGYVLVQSDINSLEQVVLAELSKDESLMKLYGPEAKANDVYLFVGAQLPVLRDAIRAAGYDPDAPTEEAINNAKKHAKKERSIAKVVVLASSYGAGVNKIWKTLTLSGIDIDIKQVEQIHRKYWEIFAGVKRWGSQLQEEWRYNCGFTTTRFGFPVCVDDKKTKDMVNRNCQKTGHDCHTMWVSIFTEMMDKEGIEWHPFILDWHDESIIECKKEDAPRVAEIIGKDSYDELNRRLKWSVRIEGSVQIVKDLADAKMEG